MNEDILILVDLMDNEIGSCPKLETHSKGLLHRAFSVFLSHGNKLLLQKRALGKYHSGGLLANACCSHPRRGEKLKAAVQRRMQQELGVQCAVEKLHSFVYFAEFNNGLSEYEYDHIFIGEYDGILQPNPEEIAELSWVSLNELEKNMMENPWQYSAWFLTSAPWVISYIRTGKITEG